MIAPATSCCHGQWMVSDACRYCQNLSQDQAARQPYQPGVYRDYSCVLTAQQVLVFLTIEWLVYFFIAIYLDNILANESGVRKRYVLSVLIVMVKVLHWWLLRTSWWSVALQLAMSLARGEFALVHS